MNDKTNSIFIGKNFIKNYSLFAAILISFFVNSCTEDKNSDSIIGVWAIKSIRFENVELLNTYYSNLIIFEDDGTCNLPLKRIGPDTKSGEWKAVLGSDMKIKQLKIIAKDTLFNHSFDITNKMLFDPEDGHKPILAGLTLANGQVKIVLQGRLSGFY
jgi:hypothetical protein